MSQDPEKYLYFTIGLLKGSTSLEALRKDALRYHMIDHPEKLIALRLTEYYELLEKGSVSTSISLAQTIPNAVPIAAPITRESTSSSSQNGNGSHASQEPSPSPELNTALPSPDAEQNAEDAASYWTLL